MPEENNSKKVSFVRSKLFAVLVAVVSTMIVMSLAGWLIFIVLPSMPGAEEGTEDVRDEETLAINKIDFDPTGKTGYNVTFVFNQDVVTDEEIGKDIKDKQFFKFEPKIPEDGVYVWESTYRLTFKPNTGLLPSTEYKAIMQPGAFDMWKGKITNKLNYDFKTVMFKVETVSGNMVKDLDNTNVVKYKFNIFFNLLVTPEDVKKHTKITLDNEEISYTIQDLPTGTKIANRITLTTADIKKLDKVQYLNLTITEDLKCSACQIGLEEKYEHSARIGEREYLNIYDVAVFSKEDDSQYIKLSLNQQVDADAVKSYLSISPEVDYKLSGGSYYLQLDGDFEEDTTYEITLSKGFQSIYGAEVKETITREVFIKDVEPEVILKSPSMNFTSEGYYLPKEQSGKISISTINVDKVDVEVFKVFSNNIVYFLQDHKNNFGYYDYYGGYYYDYYNGNELDRVSKSVFDKVVDVKDSKNMRVYTDIDLSEYISQEKKGIYKIKARDNDYRWRDSDRWIIATDLGMVVKKGKNDLIVWVNSLKTLDPKPFVDVKLISYTNQVIAEGKTDRNGVYKFTNLKEVMGDFKPFVVIAETKDDFSFVKTKDDQRLSTVDFEVSGYTLPENGIDTYMYMDRDIFRPGDEANIVSVLRSTNNIEIPSMPVKLKIFDPKNQVLHELKSNLDDALITDFNFDIPSYATTGYYRAVLYMGDDKDIGSYRFQVEEFMPATIKVDIDFDKDYYKPGDTVKTTVNGMTLFGPPADGRKVEAKVYFNSRSFRPDGYSKYTFGDYVNKTFHSFSNSLGQFKLDSEGNKVYTIDVSSNTRPPSLLQGNVTASVFDAGGRAVSSSKRFYVYPYEKYIGVNRLSDYYHQTDVPVPMDLVVVDKDGNEVDFEEMEVRVEKAYYVNILRRGSNGKLRYVSERRNEVVETATLTGDDLSEPYTYVPSESGSYTVTFKLDEDGSTTSIRFYAYGWGGDSFSLSEPDKLLVELDKEEYQPGDIANVIIRSPFAGKLLLTVERDRVLFQHIVNLENNTANIKLKIGEDFGPNAYVSGTLIRSIDYAEPFTPVRAFGIAPLKINNPKTKLTVNIDSPDKMEPNKPLRIKLNVPEAKSDTARVTVAAVDEGILMLTGYQNPDPHSYFYRKRTLEVDTFDLYNYIIPDEEKVKVLYSNPGGSEAENGRQASDYLQKTDTKRVKPTSLWSGIVKLDNNGNTTITMDVPEFNGTLRVMAVAIDGKAYGSASKETIVRAPIVLSPSLPRFLTMNDSYVFPIGVYNDTGVDGDFVVRMKDNGFVNFESAEQKVFVKNGKEEIIYFNVESKNKIGDVYFTIEASGNGKNVEKKIEMPQRSHRSPISEVVTGSLKAGEPVSLSVAEGWIPDATEFSLKVSSLPSVKFTNSLSYLLRYPYGCAEQTTSKVFPLLYFDDLVDAAEPGLTSGTGRESAWYIERGIRKLESMQRYDGSISYWPGGSYTNDWASIYVAHFLIEARKSGHQVSQRVIDGLMDWLKTVVNRNLNDDKYYYRSELTKKCYAHYVLALAGDPQLAGMFYIKNNLLGDLYNSAKYMLTGALALSGQIDLGKELLDAKYNVESDTERETGNVFRSTTRTVAIMLNVLAEVDSNHQMIPDLIEELESKANHGRWYSTQDNAFAMLAIGKVYKKRSGDNYTVRIADKRLGQLGTYQAGNKPLNIELGNDSELELTLDGSGEAYYSLTMFGIPSVDVEPYDKGIKVRRKYVTADNKHLDLSDVKVGQLVVAKITIEATKSLENVAIVDLLPAGFEIENPRLSTSSALSWADSSYSAQYMDIRDDRLMLFSNVSTNDRTFYYTLRAVTEGSFKVPAIMAEAMYDPDFSSLYGAGNLTIKK